MKIKLIVLSIICGCFNSLANNKLLFRNLSVDDGLSNNTVHCIFKDSRNYIWLGLANGLNKFDGVNLSSYSQFDGQAVVSLCEPDSTNIYVATEKHLYKYNRKENTITSYNVFFDENTASAIKKIHLDKSQNLYILTNKSLLKLENETVTDFWHDKTNNIGNLTDLDIDTNTGTCWVTSENGLVRCNSQYDGKTYYISKEEPHSNNISSLNIHDGVIYLGAQNMVFEFDIRTESFNKIATIDNNLILGISYEAGKLYLGTNGGGLKIVSIADKSIQTIAHDPNNLQGLNSNAIYSFLIDGNILWIGTYLGGVSYTPTVDRKFEVFKNEPLINTKDLNIRSLHINGNKKVLGTRDGFYYVREGKKDHFSTKNVAALKSNIILCIYPFENDYLIGTYGGGLYRFNPDKLTIEPFRNEYIFNMNSFYRIIPDQKGNLWFASLGGAIKYNVKDNTYQVFDDSNSGLPDNNIYYALIDSQNRVWLATRNGVVYYENGKIQHPVFAGLPPIQMVRYIFEDNEQNIWLGTDLNGAFKIAKDLKSSEAFDETSFLPDNCVSSIIQDNEGFIWMSTNKGVVRYKPDTKAYYIYAIFDGIPWYIFNSAVQMTQDGTIWWGNDKGLVYINPSEKLYHRNSGKKIGITKIYIDGKLVEVGSKNLPVSPVYIKTLKLDYTQKSVGIYFSDFSYGYPQSEIYEYKLDGVDNNWHKVIGQNNLYISNLSSGKYKLHIRKAGSEETIKTLDIVKETSYTLYLWILVIMILLTLSVLTIIKILIPQNRRIKDVARKTSEDFTERIKYQNVKIEKGEFENLKNAIIKYMEEEQPYLNPEFKLDDVAKAMDCSRAKISQVLNQYLDSNFSNFVNRYRIEMFKNKASEGLAQHYTLTALGRECGFNSRSSFFYSMKKLTGQTPLEFLKDAGIDLEK